MKITYCCVSCAKLPKNDSTFACSLYLLQDVYQCLLPIGVLLDEKVVVLVELALPLPGRARLPVKLHFPRAFPRNQLRLLLLVQLHRDGGSLVALAARRQSASSSCDLLVCASLLASRAPERVHLLACRLLLFSRTKDSIDHSFVEHHRVL